MSFINYFKPIETISPDEAREKIKGKAPGELSCGAASLWVCVAGCSTGAGVDLIIDSAVL